VKAAVEAGITVLAVPGPTAMASALSVSGMEISEFTFYGFLPRQKNELREKLLDMARHSRIAVIHESPHRIIDLMTVLADTLPGTYVSASCDLTKKFEQTTRGTATEVLASLKNNPKADKGEYCIALQWAEEEIPEPEQAGSDLSLEAQLFDGLIRGLTLRESMEALVAAGERKNAVKAAGLRVKGMLAEEE